MSFLLDTVVFLHLRHERNMKPYQLRCMNFPEKLGEKPPYVPGSKLPLRPYNRGWSSTQVRGGLYTHYKDSVIKGGRFPIQLVVKPSIGMSSWWNFHLRG